MCCRGRIAARECLQRDAAAFKVPSASPRPQICWGGCAPSTITLIIKHEHLLLHLVILIVTMVQNSFHPQITAVDFVLKKDYYIDLFFFYSFIKIPTF